MLNLEEQRVLLQYAREAIRRASAGLSLPEVPRELRTPALQALGACFVTIHKAGELRGCIGQIIPTRPLHEAVIQSAHGCAVRDTRFEAPRSEEVDDLDVEISVLSRPVLVNASGPDELLAIIAPHKHGVLLECQGQTSTFLPQVWESLPDKPDFMERLSRKAGLPRDAWREPTARISVYEVQSFEDGPAHHSTS